MERKRIQDRSGLLLSETKREIVIGRDISRCCHGQIRQRGIYPFNICCDECNEDLEFEHQIIFKVESP